jgi:hypothetical protein
MGRRRGLLGVVLLVIAPMVSGCVTGKAGTEYAVVLRQLGPPKAGTSRVVFLSEKGASGSGSCELAIDIRTVGRVRPGTYAYADIPAGRRALVATQALIPGDSWISAPSPGEPIVSWSETATNPKPWQGAPW